MAEAEDDLENDVDEIIRNCGGNPRAAIRALIIANTYLEAEVERLAAALSVGFTYGRWRQAPKAGK
jgi:hypothetical protein